ncbi:MAG: DNA cytosine methyltransferase [Candidatus Pacearchaeota archaeon]
MNYLDLFSGIGGFRLGLESAGMVFDYEAHSEIDKAANSIYMKHFPKSEDLGDVRTIQTERLPAIDIITFGFPCQDLSVAGKRRGLDGSRSGLFYEAIRIIQGCRPKTFIFENVKGLLSINNGRDFETVLRTITDIGLYDCEWQLLNTKWFLPQNRERIYFVGHLRGQGGFKVFPIGESCKISDGEKSRVSYCLDANYYKGVAKQARTMIQVKETKGNSQGARIYNPERF